ncbi:isochorismatase family protein [Salmonella enterica subsp. enterica]|uniref:Isochorismatase family protein n=1 Tax=Salmonella enterica I TaxID=59201 RepID=A0A3R1AIZ2_SALET|nr:isochorismatase family protein [Salmonella enterica subsp. enterica serovar Kidderminster]
MENLILTGITTSGVVLSTVGQAFDLDYYLIVVSDCCADPDQETDATEPGRRPSCCGQSHLLRSAW